MADNVKRILPILLLVMLIVILPKVIPQSYSSYGLTVLIFAGIYVIILLGLDLILGYCGQIAMGHNGFFAIGAYTTAILAQQTHLPHLFIILLGILLTSFVAYVIGVPTLRLRGFYLALATLAFGSVIYSIVVGYSQLTGGYTGIRNIPHFKIFQYSFDTELQNFYLIWFLAISSLIFTLNIARSRIGRTLKTIQEDEVTSGALMIHVDGMKLRTFVLSSVYASFAGSLYAHYVGFICPSDFTFMITVHLFLMLFIGGKGTVWGCIIGALFFKILQEFTARAEQYELALQGMIFMLVLILMPNGIMGWIRRISGRSTLRRADN